MDWKVFLLLLLAVNVCYGQNTCKTNPSDSKCYCVLDSTKNTDNWHEAASSCADEKGILVDIGSQDTSDFVVSLMTETSVTDAWVGVKGDSSSAVLVSDPSTAISYPTTWTTSLDSVKMCASITSGGNWEGVECSGSGNQKSTICRMPQIDSSGYNIDTGCPFNGFLYGSKCYQTFTWTTGKMFIEALDVLTNTDFCKAKIPTGKLILPVSDDENQFILKVGKLSGLEKFWIRVEYGVTFPHYFEYNIGTPIPYGKDKLTPAIGDNEKYFINMPDGSWGKQLVYFPVGLMCEFDVGTPGAAEPSVCPVPTNVETTPVITTPLVSTDAVSTIVISTAAGSSTEPKTAVSATPTASKETASPQGFYIVTCLLSLFFTAVLCTIIVFNCQSLLSTFHHFTIFLTSEQ